jgi:glycosyltransferase involved in cell wall biosynthesis
MEFGSLNSEGSTIAIAVPAWSCGDTIDGLIQRLNALRLPSTIFVLDDASTDDSSARAKAYDNVILARNETNLGFGGTSKRLYQISAGARVDLLINVHGDLGHTPEVIVQIIADFKATRSDFVYGPKLAFIAEELSNFGPKLLWWLDFRRGMRFTRVFGHLGLTFAQNLLFGQKLRCHNGGVRGAQAKAVQWIVWIVVQDLADWYDFDTMLLVKPASSDLSIISSFCVATLRCAREELCTAVQICLAGSG